MSTEVLKIIEQLASDGVVMLIVTHEIPFARRIANRVLFLEKGSVVSDTSNEDFFTSINNSNERIARFLQSIHH